MLPTGLWQACAEVAACEECSPLGNAHVRAKPGKAFVSAECFLMSTVDLAASLTWHTNGLVHCDCGLAVGEWQQSVLAAQKGAYRTGTKKMQLCSPHWRPAGLCQAAAISLYKHRLSFPTPPDNSSKIQTANLLEDFTEESSVGFHLLGLRSSQGHSRFLLLPGHPEMDKTEDVEALDTCMVEALEIRIVVPELLLLLGPECSTAKPSPLAPLFRRVAKVYYRSCSCSQTLSQGCTVVVPQQSFHAVCSSLNSWVNRLPPSSSISPLATPSQGGKGSCWRTSFLSLPPCDLGND